MEKDFLKSSIMLLIIGWVKFYNEIATMDNVINTLKEITKELETQEKMKEFFSKQN